VLTVTAASGTGIGRAQLAARIADARKTGEAATGGAIAELAAAGLVTAGGPVVLTGIGQAAYQRAPARGGRSSPGCRDIWP
jgi:hypothetical protein